ncbi:MAG: thioredoxin family protein [Deltaproteobacteria bacterium]|nr:thioredoxin family protein [Deltaproteobacteria bacterium]
MKIEFYRTILCPRCLYVGHALKKIVASSPHLELETIEVATNLTRTRHAGIKTVPAIRIGNNTLTGIILTPQAIRHFIEQHL